MEWPRRSKNQQPAQSNLTPQLTFEEEQAQAETQLQSFLRGESPYSYETAITAVGGLERVLKRGLTLDKVDIRSMAERMSTSAISAAKIAQNNDDQMAAEVFNGTAEVYATLTQQLGTTAVAAEPTNTAALSMDRPKQ